MMKFHQMVKSRICLGVTVTSTLTCKSCSNQSSSVENTWCASLSIVKMEGGSLSNLEECISEFEKEEILEGENMWFCSFCKKKKKASKQLSLQVNGRYLFIHLKRVLVNGDRVEKNKSMITLPPSFPASPYKDNSK